MFGLASRIELLENDIYIVKLDRTITEELRGESIRLLQIRIDLLKATIRNGGVRP